TGVYRGSVDVPSEWLGSGRVFLEADCGEDVLDVRFNGGDSRVAPWHPYRIEVTDDLREGANDVEIRVTNTLMNILEGIKHPPGLFTPPRLWFEHRYEIEVREPVEATG